MTNQIYRIYDTIEKIHRDDMFISAQGLLYRFVGYEVESIVEKDRYIVERSTGLYDKNKVLIYENDLIRIGDGNLIEVVQWVKEKQWMVGECPFSGFVNHDAIYKTGIETIGHRFRDSHLLEDKDQCVNGCGVSVDGPLMECSLCRLQV